jgi:hypothetical protein
MGTAIMTPTENSIMPYNILGVLKRCYLVASCMVRSVRHLRKYWMEADA